MEGAGEQKEQNNEYRKRGKERAGGEGTRVNRTKRAGPKERGRNRLLALVSCHNKFDHLCYFITLV